MGTPEFAASSLRALVKQQKHEILAVVTQPDRPKGRGHKLMMSAVKEYALAVNLPVLQPERVKDPAFMEEMKRLSPDLIVVAAFGQFLAQRLYWTCRLLAASMSMLPCCRPTAAPHLFICNLKGREKAGVTIMQMDTGMDTGAMLEKVSVPIGPEMTQGELHDELKEKGAALLLQTIDDLSAGTVTAEPKKRPKQRTHR